MQLQGTIFRQVAQIRKRGDIMDDDRQSWFVFIGGFICVIALLTYSVSPYGYWAQSAQDEQEVKEKWDSFEMEHDCLWIGEDSAGDVKGAQYLCSFSKNNNTYEGLVVKQADNYSADKHAMIFLVDMGFAEWIDDGEGTRYGVIRKEEE